MRQRPTRVSARRLLGTSAAGGLVLGAVLLVAGPASAHVTVNSTDAVQGGFSELSFRVPTESDSASTTKVQVFFPADQPLAFVSVKPHPGWHVTSKTVKLSKPISSDDGPVSQAVSKITWTADSARTALKPGEFDDFDVSVGPLPDAPSIVFKAIQTYSDGTVVRWIDPSVAGQPEPEHPAPTLALAKAGTTTATATTSSSGGSSTLSLVLSIIALVVALGAAGMGVVRRGRTAS